MDTDFVCIRQRTATDCGAACLATVAQTYGYACALENLRQRIPADAQGATLRALAETARQCGFEAQGILTDLATLPRVPMPCIAHLQGPTANHFVVIHQYEKGVFLVADPAQGLLRYGREEFASCWSGALLVLAPQARVAGPTEKIHHALSEVLPD